MSYLYQNPEAPTQLVYQLTQQTQSGSFVFSEAYGVKGNGVDDDTTALRSAIAAAIGKTLILQKGTMIISGTLTISSALTIMGQNTGSVIKYNGASGSAIIPMMDVVSSATGTVLQNFTLDQNADRTIGAHTGDYYINPTIYGANIALGGSILNLQADNCKALNLTLLNSWDNGISIVQSDGSSGQNNGKPLFVECRGIKSKNCGSGYHSPSGGNIRNGDGIDNGTGSFTVISDCQDEGSSCGFSPGDIGGGGSCAMSNCVAYGNGKDVGLGFYCAAGQITMTNCQAFFSSTRGFWIDTVSNSTFDNLLAFNTQQAGFHIQGASTSNFTNCRAIACSAAGSGLYNAFNIDTTAASLANMNFANCSSYGSTHKYGFGITGANQCSGNISGGNFQGTTSAYNISGYNMILNGNVNSNSFNYNVGQLILSPQQENVSYTSQPFGDFQQNGSLFIQDKNVPDKRLCLGIDPVFERGTSGITGAAVMQSIWAGIIALPTLICPSGGDVLLAQKSNGGSYPFIPSNNQLISSAPQNYTGWVALCHDDKNSRLNVYSNNNWDYCPTTVKEFNSNYGSSLVRNSYTTGNSDRPLYKISGSLDVATLSSGTISGYLTYTSPTGTVSNILLSGINNDSTITNSKTTTGPLSFFDVSINCQTGSSINLGVTGDFSGVYASNFRVTKI